MTAPFDSTALVRLDERLSFDPADRQPLPPIKRLRRWLFGLIFLLPVLSSFAYNFLIATPRYASDMAFVVRSSDTQHERLSIVSLGQGGGIGTSDNSEAVVAYLKSRDLIDRIDRDGFVTRTFSKPGLDPIAQFPSMLAGTRREDFYRHFQSYVQAEFDRATDIIHVQVQSFTPADAQGIASRMLEASEAMVNRLNLRAQANMVGEAQRNAAEAAAQLDTVLAQMTVVRGRDHIIDPELNSGASIKLESGTAAALARTEVQLSQTIRAAPQSPLIGQLHSRRSALESELANQVKATAGGDGSLASRLRAYENLAARRDMAEKQLTAAGLELAGARNSASRQRVYLEQIARPNMPDEARYPRRWLNLLLTALIAGCVLWIASSLAELVFSDE